VTGYILTAALALPFKMDNGWTMYHKTHFLRGRVISSRFPFHVLAGKSLTGRGIMSDNFLCGSCLCGSAGPIGDGLETGFPPSTGGGRCGAREIGAGWTAS
jgi:hypothetical protein